MGAGDVLMILVEPGGVGIVGSDSSGRREAAGVGHGAGCAGGGAHIGLVKRGAAVSGEETGAVGSVYPSLAPVSA